MSLGDSPERGHKNPASCSVLCAILVVTVFSEPWATGADWPGFRGPNVDGVSTESNVFPKDGAISLEIAWKRTIGSGYSGVAIADGFVVTFFSDGTSDVVVAFDELSGDERWRFEIDKTYAGHDGSHSGPIATPLIAGGRVFGLAPRGRLFGLDLNSGSLIWSTNLADDHAATKPHYGFATSPFMQDSVLIVQTGSKVGAVAGFDPSSGKRLWAIGEDGIQYQSPIPLTLFGRPQVVATGNTKLFGIDTSKGTVLWDYEHGGSGPRGAMSLVPVPVGVDTLLMAFKDDASTVVRLKRESDAVAGVQLWESRVIRNSYNVPVYHEGHVYAYSSRFLTCVDAATGESKWRSRKPGDGFTILVDGHLVILTKHGSVHIVEASPDSYRELASLEALEDMAWSPPAFANGHIVARGLKEIARLRIGGALAVSAAKPPTTDTAGHARFARFLTEVASATDKSAAIERLMKEIKHFPITEDDRVHFVYRGPGDDIAVGSDIFGARQERAMTRIEGTDFFYYSVPFDADARANYIFIKDFEDHLTDPLNPRKTATAIYGKEMEMSFSGALLEMSWFAMPKWKAPDYRGTPMASQRGQLKSQELKSKLEGTEISLDVYLPAGYERSSRKHPVAYVHGGHTALERGDWQKALDNLIGSRIEPIIAVFINYTPSVFRPNKYPEMFVEELVPFIDKNYRTIASYQGRASIGAGFTGAIAVACTFQKPHVIGKLGCQSPVMFGMSDEYLERELTPFEGKPLDVYIEWGKYDLRNPDEAWNMAEQAEKFSDLMRQKGQHLHGGEVHDGTGWSSWRNRTDLLLAALFPKH